MLRESKIDYLRKTKIKVKINEFIENMGCEFQSPLETIKDYIKGDQIICECQNCQKDKHSKKVSGMSGRHSGMRYFFFSDCCIAFLDRAFRHIRDIRLRQ